MQKDRTLDGFGYRCFGLRRSPECTLRNGMDSSRFFDPLQKAKTRLATHGDACKVCIPTFSNSQIKRRDIENKCRNFSQAGTTAGVYAIAVQHVAWRNFSCAHP